MSKKIFALVVFACPMLAFAQESGEASITIKIIAAALPVIFGVVVIYYLLRSNDS